MKAIEVFTDGACRGNPGPGGWGVLLIIDGKEASLCGGEKDTCLLYTSPSPRDRQKSRMPSSA